MKSILLTYDIKSQHYEVKKELINGGFKDTISGPNGVTYLPNTSFAILTERTTTGILDYFLAICNRLNVQVERAIAVEFNEWCALFGDPQRQ